MVALFKMLKRLGTLNSSSDSSLLQSKEAAASGVDDLNMNAFLVLHILFIFLIL